MDLILCHRGTDFDTLGAAIGLATLHRGSSVVLTDDCHPSVQNFLALYDNRYPLVDSSSVNCAQIRSLFIVGTQLRDCLGKTGVWLDLPHVEQVYIYDHHVDWLADIPATFQHIEAVGATTTLIVELLQGANISLNAIEATAMALGIHLSTRSLTNEQTTPRDAHALAWLMDQSVHSGAIANYFTSGLSSPSQAGLTPDLERGGKPMLRVGQSPTARQFMSAPVRTIRPETTIMDANRLLLRYGHSGLCVVNHQGHLTGIVARRDLDIAMHHGFMNVPVKGWMKTDVKTITPDTPLPVIEDLMVTYDVGRLPVLHNSNLVGIVTRTDVLRQIHRHHCINRLEKRLPHEELIHSPSPHDRWSDRLAPPLWELLQKAALLAEHRGWHLYLVGGAVRDLWLQSLLPPNKKYPFFIPDIDLVVDGYHQALEPGAGMELARTLQIEYPTTRLHIHGQFQTAALVWQRDSHLGSLWVDIATARTEFYPYPAAHPEVEAASIHQDLSRRDFTINALALRLTQPDAGELLDFFGGLPDLEAKLIRVLHPNSFIEDPTRIYRAVRFATRLGFRLEPQTEGFIRYAMKSGIYPRTSDDYEHTPGLQTRLKAELKSILESPSWQPALKRLDNLGALGCLHPSLMGTPSLWRSLRLVHFIYTTLTNSTNIPLHPLPPKWQLLVECLLIQLVPECRLGVAANLQLPADSRERLKKITDIQRVIAKEIPQCCSISAKVHYLKGYTLPLLLLIAAHSPPELRRSLWCYLREWMYITPALDGNQLMAMGYKPGKLFKEILDSLLMATLDGEVDGEEQAVAWVEQHYPLHELPGSAT